MGEIIRALPTKHKIVFVLVDINLTLTVWSQILIFGEVIRNIAGGLPALISSLLLVFYIGSFVFTLLLCTFILGVIYTFLKGFGVLK